MRGPVGITVYVTILSIACNQSGRSNLEKKARCAALGRTFISDVEKRNYGDPIVMNASFAYNTTSDTCLCRYEEHWKVKGGGTQFTIVDILSNRTLAYYDTTIPQYDKHLQHFQVATRAMDDDRQIPPEPK